MHWKTIKSEIALKNDFFTIKKDKCEKQNGEIVESYYTIERPTVAVICALTKNNELVLINQYRYPVKSEDIEIPAGYIEPHEKNIEQAAKRELLEETGYEIETLIHLKKVFASAGLMNNDIHFFLGLNAKKIKDQTLDTNEEIEVKLTPWEEALTLYEKGKIKDMASVTGILLVKDYFKKLQNAKS